MSDIILKKLSELTAVTTMAATDYFPVNVDVGAGTYRTRRINKQDIPFSSGAVTYLDAEDGNDSRGLRGDFNRRFQTAAAAVAACSAGDLIVVFPGTYVVTGNIAKDGVDWHLLSGATISAVGASSAIFDDGPTGLNADMIFNVTGYGVLAGGVGNANGRIVAIGRTLSNVNIKCQAVLAIETEVVNMSDGTVVLTADQVISQDLDDSGYAFGQLGGTLTLNIDTLTLQGGGGCRPQLASTLNYSGRVVVATTTAGQTAFNSTSSGTCRINVTQSISASLSCILSNAGTVYANVREMYAGTGGVGSCFVVVGTAYLEADILSTSSTGGFCIATVSACSLQARVRTMSAALVVANLAASSGSSVITCQTSTGRWNITGAARHRVVSVHATGIDSAGAREPFNVGTTAPAILQDCVGVGVGSASYSITSSGSSVTPRIYNWYTTNLAPNPIITFAVGGANVTTDVDVV